MKQKLVDPCHFFDECGNHVGQHALLRDEVKRLRAENETLKRALRTLKNKLPVEPVEEIRPTLH